MICQASITTAASCIAGTNSDTGTNGCTLQIAKGATTGNLQAAVTAFGVAASGAVTLSGNATYEPQTSADVIRPIQISASGEVLEQYTTAGPVRPGIAQLWFGYSNSSGAPFQQWDPGDPISFMQIGAGVQQGSAVYALPWYTAFSFSDLAPGATERVPFELGTPFTVEIEASLLYAEAPDRDGVGLSSRGLQGEVDLYVNVYDPSNPNTPLALTDLGTPSSGLPYLFETLETPEPTTWGLGCAGIAIVCLARRRAQGSKSRPCP